MNDKEITFGPRPEKIWVGMKAINREGTLVELKEINSRSIGFLCHWSNGINTNAYGDAPIGTEIIYNISQWELPDSCESSKEEPDWKVKYEQLREHYAHLEHELNAYEGAYNVMVRREDRLQEENSSLKRKLRETQSELKDVYKAQSKLNKIVQIVNELEDDESEWDEEDYDD